MKLPADSKALLADRLVESLDLEDPDEIQRLWSTEAIRRRDEIRSGGVQAVAGAEVLEEARRLVGRPPQSRLLGTTPGERMVR